MPETTQELLSNYTDIPRLNRAKVEDATGQKGDGIINYNDPAIILLLMKYYLIKMENIQSLQQMKH